MDQAQISTDQSQDVADVEITVETRKNMRERNELPLCLFRCEKDGAMSSDQWGKGGKGSCTPVSGCLLPVALPGTGGRSAKGNEKW